MDYLRPLSILDLEGGAIIERMELELQEVIADCFDVNKEADSIREVFCKIKIKPDVSRKQLAIGIETGNKLGKRHMIGVFAFLDDENKTALEPTPKEVDMFTDNLPSIPNNVTVISGGGKEKKHG